MSDNEDLEIPMHEVTPPEPSKNKESATKPKKAMSELQLEKLKLAREKAAQVKKSSQGREGQGYTRVKREGESQTIG